MIDEKKLETRMADLDIAQQTLNRLRKHKIEKITDFLLYDCEDNTKYVSYGINRLRISRNGRNRIYDSLLKMDVPRAFAKNKNGKPLKLHTEIFNLPLSYGTINKLYRMNFFDLEDCLELSLLDKRSLGNDSFMELRKLANVHNYQLKIVPLAKDTKIIDFDNPKRFNVVENGRIKWDHNNGDFIEPWAKQIAKYGFETLQDVEEYGYNLFLLKHGENLGSYLEEYGIKLNEKIDSEVIAELRETREMLKLFLNAYENKSSLNEETIQKVKRKIKNDFK